MSPNDIATLFVSLGYGAYVPVWLSIVGVFAAVATQMSPPTAASGRPYRALYRVVNLMAMNVGYARNANAPQDGGSIARNLG